MEVDMDSNDMNSLHMRGVILAVHQIQEALRYREDNRSTINRKPATVNASSISSLGSSRKDHRPLLYEIRDSNIHGKGIFATKDIRSGTRIIAEKPHMIQTGRGDIKMVMEAFKRLTMKERATFVSLQGLPWHTQKLMSNITTPTTSADARVVLEQIALLGSIWANNAVSQNHAQDFVIHLDMCRLNHSCIPNTIQYSEPGSGLFVVVAITPIAAGDELTRSYAMPLLAHEQRLKVLQWWQFQCNCRACDLSSPFGQMIEKRRRNIQQLAARTGLADSLGLTAYPALHFQEPEIPVNDALAQLVGLLWDIGVPDTTYQLAYRKAFALFASKGKWQHAYKCLNEYHHINLVIFGQDNPRTVRGQKAVDDFLEWLLNELPPPNELNRLPPPVTVADFE
ncbi:SET domain-containing protein [Lepidopterella palustris CBS 459.81]|uniref:SET domain-containing protein n=1 Tax=Lepidopterella palustris CBS 459.81 TaxID=1314670 RepID=A0A8E2JFN4_9PEZI|nr:SET domain-containing protein [Lepidopterella palustris CBS 459.81]